MRLWRKFMYLFEGAFIFAFSLFFISMMFAVPFGMGAFYVLFGAPAVMTAIVAVHYYRGNRQSQKDKFLFGGYLAAGAIISIAAAPFLFDIIIKIIR